MGHARLVPLLLTSRHLYQVASKLVMREAHIPESEDAHGREMVRLHRSDTTKTLLRVADYRLPAYGIGHEMSIYLLSGFTGLTHLSLSSLGYDDGEPVVLTMHLTTALRKLVSPVSLELVGFETLDDTTFSIGKDLPLLRNFDTGALDTSRMLEHTNRLQSLTTEAIDVPPFLSSAATLRNFCVVKHEFDETLPISEVLVRNIAEMMASCVRRLALATAQRRASDFFTAACARESHLHKLLHLQVHGHPLRCLLRDPVVNSRNGPRAPLPALRRELCNREERRVGSSSFEHSIVGAALGG